MKLSTIPERMVLGVLVLAVGMLVGCSEGGPGGGALEEEPGEGRLGPGPITEEQEEQTPDEGEENPEPPGDEQNSIPDDENDEGSEGTQPSHSSVALRLAPTGDLPEKVLGAKVYVDRILVENEYNQNMVPLLDKQNMALEIDLLKGYPVLLADIPLTIHGSVLVRVFFKGQGELALEANNAGPSTLPIVNMTTVKLRIRSMINAAPAGVDMQIDLPESMGGLEGMQYPPEAPFIFAPKGDYNY